MPWVLRHCPESKRKLVVLIIMIAGFIAHLVFFMAGVLGIFLVPLHLATEHPDAPIAFPIRWLSTHFSHDTAVLIYAAVQLGVATALIYLIVVVDYLRYDSSQRDKQDVG